MKDAILFFLQTTSNISFYLHNHRVLAVLDRTNVGVRTHLWCAFREGGCGRGGAGGREVSGKNVEENGEKKRRSVKNTQTEQTREIPHTYIPRHVQVG